VNEKKPNFLYLGATRTGSTWLYLLLSRHPQIFIPDAKDIWFFDRDYKRGLEWYENFFKGVNHAHKAVGEISHYLFHEETAKRIHEYRPNIKLIINLRDPMERFLSHYHWMTKRAGVRYGGVIDFGQRYPQSEREGKSAEFLSKFLKYFRPDQFFIFDFELIASNPKGYLNSLLSFLGCDPNMADEGLMKEKVFDSREPRFRPLNLMLYHFATLARKLGQITLVGKLKHSGHMEKFLFKRQKAETKLSTAEETYLYQLYRDDVRLLQKVLKSFVNKMGEFSWVSNY